MIGTKSSVARSKPTNPPVIDLTVEQIDLTNLDDTPPTSPRVNGVSEPPRKRQRLSNDTALQSPSRNLSACLKAQVKPYIDACLAQLPPSQVNVTDLGRAVLCRIGSIDKFSVEFTHKKGFLSPALEQHLAETARNLISKYASKPEFQLSPTPAISPAPGTLNTNPATPRSTSTRTPSLLKPSPAKTVATATSRVSSIPTSTATSSYHAKAPRSKHDYSTRKHTVSPSSPAFGSNARAGSWKSWKEQTPKPGHATSRHKAVKACLQLPKWPYITTEERRTILRGTCKPIRAEVAAVLAKGPIPFHVDFTPDEMEAVRRKIREMCEKKAKNKRSADTSRELGKLLRKRPNLLTVIPAELELRGDLARRDEVAIRNLLDELVDRHKRPARHPKVLTLEVDEFDKKNESGRSSRVPSLLFAREIDGNRGFGRMRRLVNFTNEFRKAHEDDMDIRAEWVNCAGDIMTIAWTSDNNFICGTTTHSDSHNQQYNREGNLLLCSTRFKQLQAFADHRIPRPAVERGDNSTEAMRESQSPWLYSSVVSSDYDKVNDRAYTSSFDRTVKVWKVAKDGKDMTVLGTWQHAGNVNFVAASKHESGMVATAADVASQAVRVYHVHESNVSGSSYRAYSNMRAWNEGNEQTTATQKWAYFPATMQWGLTANTRHLLLVGYSPRSFTGDDLDIPEDKTNTGEICLWNCFTGERIKVMTASTQNVFEVAWHPTQPVFIVATSPAGLIVDDNTRTQIRVFRPSKTPEGDDAFSEMQCLDCPAKDINELTIKPNSVIYSYITAACTNGKVYVWDTARGDKHIHVLRHKEPIDKEDEGEDVGVKFTAWGTTADRFYTGGSDGVVKVWNVRDLRQPFVRNLLEAPGCITSGAFSPDFSKLAIGDATGRVILLSPDEDDEPTPNFIMPPMPAGLRPRGSRLVRRPLAFKSHDDPPPLDINEIPETGVVRASRYLHSGQLIRHPDPTIGVVQGPTYAELGLYRHEFHFNRDPSQPLLAKNEEEQQQNKKMFPRSLRVPRLQPAGDLGSATLKARHAYNLTQDFDFTMLDSAAMRDLILSQVSFPDITERADWDFEYEEGYKEEDYEEE